MAEALRLDENELTIGDMEDFEALAGRSFDSLRPGKDGSVSLDAKTLKALVYVLKRKDDPTFTIEDARNVKVSELQIVPAGSDPTPVAG